MLQEVRDRGNTIKKLQQQKKKQQNADVIRTSTAYAPGITNQEECDRESEIQVVKTLAEPIAEAVKPKKPVPYVRVYDYEELKREAGRW